MRKVNEEIRKERHVTRMIDDITSKLNGSTVFSKLYMNPGFQWLIQQAKSAKRPSSASEIKNLLGITVIVSRFISQ